MKSRDCRNRCTKSRTKGQIFLCGEMGGGGGNETYLCEQLRIRWERYNGAFFLGSLKN